jgi:DNA repair exonuclease SbcCD ATPase subunit
MENKLIGKQSYLKLKSLVSLFAAVLLSVAPVFSEAINTTNTESTSQGQKQPQILEQSSTTLKPLSMQQTQSSAQQTAESQSLNQESTQLSNLLDEQDNLLNLFDSKLTTLEAQVTTLEQSVKDSSATNSQLESQLKSCKETITNLRTDLSQLSDRLQDSNESLAKAQDDLDAYDLKIKSLELQISIYKPVIRNTYISEGIVTAAGIALIFIGNNLPENKDVVTSIGIGICSAGGICFTTTGITQLIKLFSKKN